MAGYTQPMPRRPPTLASDQERDRAARALRRHFAAGRLDAEELERRLSLAVSARTRTELRALFRDLPRGWGSQIARVNRVLLRAHAGGYVVGNGALIGIWDLAGGGPFWPAWALVPTTGMLVWHAGVTWAGRRLVR